MSSSRAAYAENRVPVPVLVILHGTPGRETISLTDLLAAAKAAAAADTFSHASTGAFSHALTFSLITTLTTLLSPKCSACSGASTTQLARLAWGGGVALGTGGGLRTVIKVHIELLQELRA